MNQPESVSRIWQMAEAVRESAPLVHNLSNLVVQNDTADAIAAIGGTQVTLHNLEEARDIAGICAAVAVNLGTLNSAFLSAARDAVAVARELGRPWVLDPVAAGLTKYRTQAALEFLALRPTLVKANASEILVLAGSAEGGHGADSIHPVQDAAVAAKELAVRYGAVIVVSGPEDMITDGRRTAIVSNGRPLMGRMIGSGCMLTSVAACFLSLGGPPFDAALAAVACFNVAGEIASEQAGGPGTLKPLLLDALDGLTRESLRDRARLTEYAGG